MCGNNLNNKVSWLRGPSRRPWSSGFVLAALLLGAFAPQARAGVITNVTLVNVTPTSFSVLWRSSAATTPSVAVFADAGGSTNLAGQLGVEALPLHTGSPDAPTAYDRRLSQQMLRSKTQGLGLVLMRVTGCRPNTTYYYQLTASATNSPPTVYPDSGPLPSVTTEKENSFVVDAEQLIIDVPGLDTAGRVVLLTHTNAAHPLASVVGDGVGTNQVFFNASDLFALAAAGGNFAPIGAQQFTADVLGPNQTHSLAQFTLNFGTNFVTAAATSGSMGIEFLALTMGSTVLQTGQTTNVPLSFNTSVGLASVDILLDLPPGHLTNLTLQALAPEIDPALASVTPQGGTLTRLHLPARAGQAIFGAKQAAQLTFTATPGQHSAFVPLKMTQITAAKADSTLLTNLFGQSGRAVVIGPEGLLEAYRDAQGKRSLTLYGNPNSSYAIESASQLNDPITWNPLPVRIPMTTLSVSIQGLDPAASLAFYRAVEFFADPPLLDAAIEPDGTHQLTVYGKPGLTYLVQYAPALTIPMNWTTVLNVPLSASFAFVPMTNAIGGFYRVIPVPGSAGPTLQALVNPDRSRSLVVSGQTNTQYTVEYSTNLSSVTAWYPLVNVSLTTSTTGKVNVANTNNLIFYRLRKN